MIALVCKFYKLLWFQIPFQLKRDNLKEMDMPMRLFICLNLLWILSFSAVACLIASIATKNWLVNEKEDLDIGLWDFCQETRCVIKNY